MAKLLIVDDDEDVAEILSDALRSRGHEVRVAPDGEAGLRELSASIPDVVLLDVEMPFLDGPTMAGEMLIRDCGLEAVPIVLLSGVVGLGRLAERVGTPYFHSKPYSEQDIVALLDRALRERTPPTPKPEN